MRYKPGDKVKIKSLEWYNQNKDENGFVHCGDRIFDDYMSVFCGSVVTICGVSPYGYDIREDMKCRTWTEDMIEGLADDTQEKMISLDKACEWLENIIDDDVFINCGAVVKFMQANEFVEYFRKSMEI